MILKAISLNLNTKLEASDIYLPLTASDTAYLTSVVPEGEEIYLTIQWDMYREYVLASNEHGTIVLTRGVDSEARAFPKGSCVFFENSVPVTKWLICNYECCSDDCGYEAVQNAGAVLPTAKVGDTWKGTFIFKGSLPMVFGVTGLPDWCEATYSGNYITLTGIPTVTGSYNIAVSASNGKGENIAVQQGIITVK